MMKVTSNQNDAIRGGLHLGNLGSLDYDEQY
jgi:hypothetical protein